MTGISRRRWGRATRAGLATGALALAAGACGGRARSGAKGVDPNAVRVFPLAATLVLETSGPPPSDTAVTFAAGEPRTIVIRHGPPENVVFAEVSFAPRAFRADSGREVTVTLRPRPGVYGLDVITTVPFTEGAAIVFKYARYFLASAQARARYGGDVQYERALAVGLLRPEGPALALLPSTRPAADNLRAEMPAPGTYLVAAPK